MINQYGIVSAYRIGGTATIFVIFYFVISQWLVSKYEVASHPSRKDEVKLTDSSENLETKNTPTEEP